LCAAARVRRRRVAAAHPRWWFRVGFFALSKVSHTNGTSITSLSAGVVSYTATPKRAKAVTQ